MERESDVNIDEYLYDAGSNNYSNNSRRDDPPLIQMSGYESPRLTSDPSYSITSSMHVGRNKNEFTIRLERFITKNKKPPKREYFNAFIIRAIKRAFRCIISSKIPTTTCIKVNITNQKQMLYWNELGNIYRGNIQFITELSKTDTGPQTDGKKKGKASKALSNDAKSFNNKFCQEFFSNKQVQQAFFSLIEIFYSNYCPDELSERFKFSCCPKGSNHNEDCMQKWSELKDYFNVKFFEELEVPIFNNSIEEPYRLQDPGIMDIDELELLPD